MHPFAVSPAAPLRRRFDLSRITVDPFGDVEVEILLAPEHAGEGLPLYEPRILVSQIALQVGIELICIGNALLEDPFQVGHQRGLASTRQADVNARRAVCGDLETE